MIPVIPLERSVIIACESIEDFGYNGIVHATRNLEGIGGYKVGASPIFWMGCQNFIHYIRGDYGTDKTLIYDHQKGGTDIPDTATTILNAIARPRATKARGFDAVILYPFSGPQSEKKWITAAETEGLGVLVGGLMSHEGFLRSEGGFFADEAVPELYLAAAEQGVRDFIIPATKLDRIAPVVEALRKKVIRPVFYAVGIGAQGGSIQGVSQLLGRNWHAIIGRQITDHTGMNDVEEAAKGAVDELFSL